jgi:hypothetical protein
MEFNEAEWIRLLFLISDTQVWINEMEKDLFHQLPLADKKKLFKKNCYITATALAHILERHYYKITRHPGTAKFTVPVTTILHWIREACQHPAAPQPGTINFIRTYDTDTIIGHDTSGSSCTEITIISNACGEVITAFPGVHKTTCSIFRNEPVTSELSVSLTPSP